MSLELTDKRIEEIKEQFTLLNHENNMAVFAFNLQFIHSLYKNDTNIIMLLLMLDKTQQRIFYFNNRLRIKMFKIKSDVCYCIEMDYDDTPDGEWETVYWKSLVLNN